MSKFKVGDKVRILDGSNIENYAYGWCAAGMKEYIGEVRTIVNVWPVVDGRTAYMLEGSALKWDERGLEPAENKFKVGDKVVITTDGKRTITREDFREAVRAVLEEMANDPKLDGMAGFIIPLTGMTFAGKMEEKLFGKE